jgi:hypothetical protein
LKCLIIRQKWQAIKNSLDKVIARNEIAQQFFQADTQKLNFIRRIYEVPVQAGPMKMGASKLASGYE